MSSKEKQSWISLFSSPQLIYGCSLKSMRVQRAHASVCQFFHRQPKIIRGSSALFFSNLKNLVNPINAAKDDAHSGILGTEAYNYAFWFGGGRIIGTTISNQPDMELGISTMICILVNRLQSLK